MTLAYAVFFLSLVGLVGVFGLKELERKHNRVFFPSLRFQLDRLALQLRDLMIALKRDAERVPPELLHISRILIHESALSIASALRFLSLQLHKFAELVSHKRNFVRRAPRSEFLKKIIEHKNEINGQSNTESGI